MTISAIINRLRKAAQPKPQEHNMRNKTHQAASHDTAAAGAAPAAGDTLDLGAAPTPVFDGSHLPAGDVITIQPVDLNLRSVHAHVQIERDGKLHNIAVRIADAGQVAAAAAQLAGQSEIANAIAAIARYAGIALENYADADAVEITPDSILLLTVDRTPLAPPTES